MELGKRDGTWCSMMNSLSTNDRTFNQPLLSAEAGKGHWWVSDRVWELECYQCMGKKKKAIEVAIKSDKNMHTRWQSKSWWICISLYIEWWIYIIWKVMDGEYHGSNVPPTIGQWHSHAPLELLYPSISDGGFKNKYLSMNIYCELNFTVSVDIAKHAYKVYEGYHQTPSQRTPTHVQYAACTGV